MSALPDQLTVEVTADDIMLGKRGDNCECAIALALKRLPGVTGLVWVEFGSASIAYTVDGEVRDLQLFLPQEATAFIEAFDREQPVSPFTFTAIGEEL